MACILLRLWAAETAINEHASGKRIRPRVAWGSSGSGSSGFGHGNSCSGDSPASQILPIVSDRQSWANIHGTLSGIHFLRRLGLFKKMNSGFVAIVRDEIRRFFKTKAAQCAARVHVPLARRVLGLFAQIVRHNAS